MPRCARPLTRDQVEETRPGEKPVKLADGGGMYLLLRPDGARYWRLDYRFDGKRKTLALGVYPQVSLDEARRRRGEARDMLARGIDPGAARKARRTRHPAAPEADRHLEYALAIIGEGVWDWDLDTGRVRHNAQWGRLLGVDAAAGECDWQVAQARVYADDRDRVMAALQACLDCQADFECEHRIQRPDGHVIWVLNRGEVVARDAQGRALRMIGSLGDISERRRAEQMMQQRNRLLQTIASVNEMMMQELPEPELMARVCQALVSDGRFRMAWIGLTGDDGVRVRPVADAGFARGYLDNLDIRCDLSPQGQGPTGTAIRQGVTVLNHDTETNRQFAPWREQARQQGYRSSAAAPLRVHGRIAGALNVYSDTPHAFGPGEVLLLEKLAADLGIAMGHRAALLALRESEERFRLLLDSSPEAVFGVDTEGICTFVNPACLRMLGYARDELIGRNMHRLIHHTYPDGRAYPREQCNIRLATLRGESTHVDSEVHWRKDGSAFPVEYWSHPMYRDGKLVGAVVTFVDISERKHMEQALRESEERYRLISSVTTDLLYSCLRNDDGAFVVDWATASVDAIFGYSLQEILDRGCWRCFVHPDDLPVFDDRITRLQPGQHSECELRIVAKDGTQRYIRAYSTVSESGSGHRHRLYGACQDITERRRAEEALRESEARFRTMAEQSADWIWVIDIQGRRTYSNHRGMNILGYSGTQGLEIDPGALLHPEDLPLFRQTIQQSLSTRQGWNNLALRWRHQDGSYRIFESNATPVLDERGALTGFQGVDRDITERRQAEERIEFLAHHDALTGLPNRILLRDRFEQAVGMAERTRSHVAMLFLDLDNFKMVNDTLGHAAGDQLLLAVVSRLSGCLRDSDTVSRQGGDEFILLLHNIPDPETVERVAGEILVRLAEPVKINGHVLNASCSIGISMYPEDGRHFDALLQKADTAMYNAKDSGRNTYRFFDERMNLQAREHLLLQNRLHQALAQGEFHLHYQPQIDAGDGRMIGVEALLRWHNPELGSISPGRFIPVAEDCGLIVPIGDWVMREACLQAQAWRSEGLPDLAVSVNLSALQFRRANLVESVAAALRVSGLPASLLELELTESILLQDVENTLETVRQLKQLGVRLSIDDFGTGYSSLSYLRRFAVDRLKIDQSFVRDIGSDPDDAAIVRAIIQLARSLRLGIIAEGVETREQLDFLKAEGCLEVQGYLFSRPLPPDALADYLIDNGASGTGIAVA